MIVNQDIIPAVGVWADAVVFLALRVRDQPAMQAGGVEQGGVVGVWLFYLKNSFPN